MGHPHITKKCGCCGVTKSVDDFYKNPRGTKGRDGYCSECRRARDAARSADRSQKNAALRAKDPNHFRRRKLLSMYGITVAQYDAMHAEQNGKCAICAQPESRVIYGKTAYLVVDHNHETGRVRSLLCHRCNTALGSIEDVAFRLAAIAYLEKHSEPKM